METDKVLRKKIGLIILIFLVIAIIALIKPESEDGGYIENSDGELIGIYLRDEGLFDEFDLKAINQNGEVAQVSLNIDQRVKPEIESINENSFQEEIDSLISEISESDDRKIELPDELSDGSKIIWKRIDAGDFTIIPIVIMPVILIALFIKQNKDERIKKERISREQLLLELPGFSNQIILLMNSSLILNDCLIMIADVYEQIKKEKRTEFQEDIVGLVEESEKMNIACVYGFIKYANKKKIKELSRLALVMLENVEKGTDIREKFEREGEYLWESRKAISKEKGRFIETKMTVPLGLLLVVMIVITMAPAVLNM